VCPRKRELEANEWFEAEYDSLWNTDAPEEQPVPALASAAVPALAYTALASLPVPALAPAAPASLGSFGDFMSSVAHLQAPVTAQVSMVKSEAQCYLDLPANPMNTDPLEWWSTNEINFPELVVMSLQYLGVPATSPSADSLFSLAGHSFDDLRQRMKEETFEILMWTRINKEFFFIEGLRMPPPLRRHRRVVVDISDISTISGITNMVKL
jgi:hypothetical protein